MTTPTDPGWYDDPEVANAQRYWDGQSWTPQRQRKPVGQPAPPPVSVPVTSTPPPSLPPPPPQVATPDGGRAKRKVWLAVAGVGGLILALVVLAGLSENRAPTPNQSSSAGGNQPGAQHQGQNKPSWAGHRYQEGRSQAYQNGYEWGNQHMDIRGVDVGSVVGLGVDFECNHEAGVKQSRNWIARRDVPDWTQGCVDGLSDQGDEPGAHDIPIPNIQIPGWMGCLGGDETKC